MKPPVGSLAEAFIPPPGFTGEFGWVCGFSGDAEFLNLAADRFSGQSKGQRAWGGRILLGVLLDPTTPQILPGAAPGVLHLAPTRALPWALLHAKVAILSFGSPEGDKWCLRLVVSTGNWTRQTLEDSLDLVWTLDLTSRDLKTADSALACADLRAAADLLREVRARFDDTALTSPDTPSRAALRGLDARIAGLPAASKGDAPPRFLDNRGEALVRVVSTRAPQTAGAKPRNRLVIGSGFYGSGPGPGLPAAAQGLVKALRASNLLTSDPEITLVVNPASCQEVAAGAGAIRKAGWRVVPAVDPSGTKGGPRSLHAKFIFSANDWSKGTATSPWLYLGSGNLTAPGFLNRAGTAGNLEAGVLFEVEPMPWKSLGKRLPVEKDAPDLALTPGALLGGDGAPDRISEYLAPPFAYVELLDAPARLSLPAGSRPTEDVEILGIAGAPLAASADGSYPWIGPEPAEVRVRWTEGTTTRVATIPALDRFGRLAGKALPPLDFIDLEEELRSFPSPPETQEEDPGDTDDGIGLGTSGGDGGASSSNYPFREMMQAIETIAARQTAVPEAQWAAWCARLEQALFRMKATPPVAAVRGLGLNPLAVLRRPEFRPDYGCSSPSRSSVGRG